MLSVILFTIKKETGDHSDYGSKGIPRQHTLNLCHMFFLITVESEQAYVHLDYG